MTNEKLGWKGKGQKVGQNLAVMECAGLLAPWFGEASFAIESGSKLPHSKELHRCRNSKMETRKLP